MPKQKNSHLYRLDSGINIGVIGLTTDEALDVPTMKDGTFPAYKFQPYAASVIAESKKLKTEGAHAVILLSHLGDWCDIDNTYGLWFKQTPQKECQPAGELKKLLDALPPGTIDGVVQGHYHNFYHHFVNGIPVMGNINGGYYFNILYLQFKGKQLAHSFI
jgi:2',3'-cyclic-nucleotide 2'-phosphodiesterase (5'-nucleotidase family)